MIATGNGEESWLWSLVLESVAIPHRLERHGDDWRCLTPVAVADEARRQLASFADENRDWPPPPLAIEHGWNHRQPPTLPMMGALLVFYAVTGPWQEGGSWFSQGAIDSVRILDGGEWWRLLTALTLHADPVHLVGNVCFGSVLVHFLCKRLGVGLGWFLILCAGVLGNLANILIRAGAHHAVGFSTAVFGAVGILCGLALQLRSRRGVLLPLGGGASLLALLGAGAEQTDLGAHFWGLAVGMPMGWLFARLPDRYLRRVDAAAVQAVLLCACIVAVWGCWRLAR
ncbi:MAG: rhomboid family intramembrane serine protease [Desulfobulbaceae bacterium]|nr:rhomboid family intramembrane serine protease [Desulfobulbaceae bacterium]